MSVPDMEAIAADMRENESRPFVVALDAVVTTASGKVAFVARHSDGRNVAMMCPQDKTLHSDMVAMAQAAFDAQHTGPIPS